MPLRARHAGVRLAFFLLLLVGIAAAARAQGPFAIEPTSGQTLVWEFLLDAEQHNAGRPEAAPIASRGSGVGRIELDTASGVLRYAFSWSDLEGEVTALELRGPARPHQNTARRLSEFPGFDALPKARAGQYEGEHRLVEQRQAGFQNLPPQSILVVLTSGGAYVSLKTTAHPDGEIRGNLGATAGVIPGPNSAP